MAGNDGLGHRDAGDPGHWGTARNVRRRAGFHLVACAALLLSLGATFAAPVGASIPATDVAGSPVAFGDAASLGAAPAQTAAPVVGMAATPSGSGYWIVAGDGGIFTFGDAGFYGSMGGQPLNDPIVGMAATPDGKGYWLVASDGGIFTFGDAHFYGSMGGQPLNEPVVGIAATPDGKGYWEVASDGGIFSFGDAHFYGSMGGKPLNQPVVGMAAAPAGGGYLEVASDGGVFSFGNAPFYGSAAGQSDAFVVGISVTSGGTGYWLVAANGGVFAYGDAPFFGSMGGLTLADPIVGMAATPDNGGYWLLPSQLPREVLGLSPLSLGDSGPAVLALQQQLTNLGYWLGAPDGNFGDSTQQAVYALQKAAGITPDGVVELSTYAALAEGVVPHPQSTSGYVIEIDLQDDLLMFVNNGHLQYTLNTSTGGGYIYDGDVLAATPVGNFDIYRAVDGLVVDSLGALWRPRYFTGGFAIHGDSYVPPVPVSHGCVRVSNEAIDWIWAANLAPIGTAVWVY
jgi:hypothetical protein